MIRDHNEIFPEIKPISDTNIEILNNKNINVENKKTIEAVEWQQI